VTDAQPSQAEQVGAQYPSRIERIRGRALVAKNHAAQIVPEASDVFRIGGRAETLGELKELLLPALLSFDPLFHKLDDDPVGAKAPLLREAADMPRRVGRKAYGLTNDFVRSRHDTVIHPNDDARFSRPEEVGRQKLKVGIADMSFRLAGFRSQEFSLTT